MLSLRAVSVNPKSLFLETCFKVGSVFSTPETKRNNYKFPRNFKANKHWLPKWTRLRGEKVIKIDLPDFQKKAPDTITQDVERSFYKEQGLQPVRPWHEKPFSIFSLGGVVDQYVPPEGDGKLSPLNSAGAQQKLEWLKKKTKSWRELRTIRKFDEDFELYPDFVDKAQEIYIKAHEMMAVRDEEKLTEYVTEKAYPLMLFNTKRKTIHWKFIESLEPPRVCHVRTGELFSKENVFAQITVRFHTKQVLAIYDRFGRLMYGSETVAKDALEYVVFEKYLASMYGQWRVHHKIIPDWIPAREPSPRTFIREEPEEATVNDVAPETADSIVSVPV